MPVEVQSWMNKVPLGQAPEDFPPESKQSKTTLKPLQPSLAVKSHSWASNILNPAVYDLTEDSPPSRNPKQPDIYVDHLAPKPISSSSSSISMIQPQGLLSVKHRALAYLKDENYRKGIPLGSPKAPPDSIYQIKQGNTVIGLFEVNTTR